MHFDPDFSRRLSKVERYLHQFCLYLGISASGIPVNSTCFLDKLFRLIYAFEADSVQDAAKIKDLRAKTNQQAASISALQTKVEQLKLAS